MLDALLFPVKSIASVTAGINLLKWFALYLPLFFWIAKMAVERKVGWVRTPLDLPLLLYTLLVLFSLTYSIDRENTLAGIRGGYLKFVIVYLVVLHHFRTVEKLKRLATAFALSFLWIVVAGLYNYQVGELNTIGGLAALGNRHHNVVGMILGGTFPFLLLIYRRDGPLLGRVLSTGLILVGLFAVFMTLSRGTWVGVLVTVLIWGIYQNWKGVLALSVLFLLSVFSYGPHLVTQRAERLESQIGTASGRTPIWDIAVDLIQARPLFGYGYGPGIFTELYEKERLSHAAPEPKVPHEHNLFISLLIQNGIVGLVLYLWIFFGVVVLTFRTAHRLEAGPERELLILLGSGMIGEYLVHALLERNNVGFWAIPFWAMTAMALVIYSRREVRDLSFSREAVAQPVK
ncbi:MAG: O-antigen ligase family protein [Nitrospirae bacterium]|nr:O-antigen ligase family protein [Candidatus Manganitrophaceae bacterium]